MNQLFGLQHRRGVNRHLNDSWKASLTVVESILTTRGKHFHIGMQGIGMVVVGTGTEVPPCA